MFWKKKNTSNYKYYSLDNVIDIYYYGGSKIKYTLKNVCYTKTKIFDYIYGKGVTYWVFGDYTKDNVVFTYRGVGRTFEEAMDDLVLEVEKEKYFTFEVKKEDKPKRTKK